MVLPSAPTAVMPPSTSASPTYDIFISLRFAEALEEAKALTTALQTVGCSVFLCAVPEGDSLLEIVSRALSNSTLAVILGTRTYGQKNSQALFNTFQELTFILEQKKPFFLVKMCEKFSEPHTQLLLSTAISHYPWLPKTEAERRSVPPQLVLNILTKLSNIKDGSDATRGGQLKTEAGRHSAFA